MPHTTDYSDYLYVTPLITQILLNHKLQTTDCTKPQITLITLIQTTDYTDNTD